MPHALALMIGRDTLRSFLIACPGPSPRRAMLRKTFCSSAYIQGHLSNDVCSISNFKYFRHVPGDMKAQMITLLLPG